MLAGLLLGLLLGLAWFAPARWLALALAPVGALHLEDTRGTIWQGSARLWLTGGAGSPERANLPGRLHWRLRPAWTGLSLDLRADCCTDQALMLGLSLSLRDGPGLTLNDATSNWPAEPLAGLGTPWNTLQPAGRLALRTEGLAVHWRDGRARLSGRAWLELQDLSSALSTLKPMGSYRIALTGGAMPRLELETLRGGLLLSGQGSWQAGALRFQGEARAAPGREEALANFLNIVGRRDGARSLISLG